MYALYSLMLSGHGIWDLVPSLFLRGTWDIVLGLLIVLMTGTDLLSFHTKYSMPSTTMDLFSPLIKDLFSSLMSTKPAGHPYTLYAQYLSCR